MAVKQIGILTFHSANNYGAVLQAYALQKTLQRLYPKRPVKVVDYRCPAVVKAVDLASLKKEKGALRALLHYRQENAKQRQFDKFRNRRLELTEPYFDKEPLERSLGGYAAIVSGSDQVWNSKLNGGDDVYLQNFKTDGTVKFSYAASFGTTAVDESERELYRSCLYEFASISVREKSAVELVNDQLGLAAEQHIDPTLLLAAEEWLTIAEAPKKRGGYILVYMVPKQQSIIDRALKLRKETGLPIVMLSKNLKPLNVIHAGGSSPEQFLGLFANADYVLTNSFHGTAFSVIFDREFFIDLKTRWGYNLRSRSLLELCGFECSDESIGMLHFDNTDRTAAHEKLSKERERTLTYLSGMLSESD